MYFVLGNAVDLVVFDNFGSGGAVDLASEVAVYLVAVVGLPFVVAVHFVAECLEHSAEIVFDGHHPSPPLYFYKLGNLVPTHISMPLVLQQHWGCMLLDLWLYLYGGFEVIAGGIGQSFLNSNKFPDIFPASGHGVPA